MVGVSWAEEEEGKEEMQGSYHMGRCVGKEREGARDFPAPGPPHESP